MAFQKATFLDIRAERAGFADGFLEWDRAVEASDARAAKAARRTMQARARNLLPNCARDKAGWYVFADLSEGGGIGGVRYVGITNSANRSIGRRIEDRFKDDSCFDVALDDLPQNEQERIIESRLITALPPTGRNYVAKHLRTAALVRKSSHILMVSTRDARDTIKAVERLLIASAVTAGAPLINQQLRTFRAGASADAIRRASEVLESLNSVGLPTPAVARWRQALERMPRL